MKKFALRSTAAAVSVLCASAGFAQVNLDAATPTPIRFASERTISGATLLQNANVGAGDVNLGVAATFGQGYGSNVPVYVRVDLAGLGNPVFTGTPLLSATQSANCITQAASGTASGTVTSGGSGNNFVVFQVLPATGECLLQAQTVTVIAATGAGNGITVSSNAAVTGRLRVYALNPDAIAGNESFVKATSASNVAAKTFINWSNALTFTATQSAAQVARLGVDFKTALLNGIAESAVTLTQGVAGTITGGSMSGLASTLTLSGLALSGGTIGGTVTLGGDIAISGGAIGGTVTLGTGNFSAGSNVGAGLGTAGTTATLNGGIALGSGSIAGGTVNGRIQMGSGVITGGTVAAGTNNGTITGTSANGAISGTITGATFTGLRNTANRYSANYQPYSDFVVPFVGAQRKIGGFSTLLNQAFFPGTGSAVTVADLLSAANGSKIVLSGNFTAQSSGATNTMDPLALARVAISAGAACGADIVSLGKTASAGTSTISYGVAAAEGVARAVLVPGGAGVTNDFSVCLTPQSTKSLPVANFSVAITPANATNVTVTPLADTRIGSISRDGVVLVAPLVQQTVGFQSRLILTNAGTSDAPYSVRAIDETGQTSVLDASLLNGTISAGRTIILNLRNDTTNTNLITTTGGSANPRLSLEVTVQGTSQDISGMYQLVKVGQGAVSNTVLIDKTNSMSVTQLNN